MENIGLDRYSDGVYTGYHLNTDSHMLGTLDAFCVENAFSQNGVMYQLLPVSTDLQQAASLAHNYWTGSDQSDLRRAIVQVAIWNIVLGKDKFQYLSGLDDNSLKLVADLVKDPGTYSGGEQQMLAIGRGPMARPKLMMLGEPSLGLAPLMVEEIFRILCELNARDIPLLLIEQNARAALKIATQGYVLETGRTILEDTSTNLLGNQRILSAYLGGA